MNFSQLHEQLRLEILRRIKRGRLTQRLLARKTGITAAHVSQFLSQKRRMDIKNLDKVLDALFLSVPELYPAAGSSARDAARILSAYNSVPLVKEAVAIHSARIPRDAADSTIKVRSSVLQKVDKCSARRRQWERFVAVEITEKHAIGMRPLLRAGAVLVIDRHYNSAIEYDAGERSLYAVQHNNLLQFRYARLKDGYLLLTAYEPFILPELVRLPSGETSADLLVGRVIYGSREF